jgi:hypothetical protein
MRFYKKLLVLALLGGNKTIDPGGPGARRVLGFDKFFAAS